MRKLGLLFVLFLFLLIPGCISSPPNSRSVPAKVEEAIFAAVQQEKSLILNIYRKKDLFLIGSVKIMDLKTEYPPPVILQPAPGNKLVIGVMAVDDRTPDQVFIYDGNEGRVSKKGELPSVANMVVVDGKLYSTRVDSTGKGTFWLDEYDLADLQKSKGVRISVMAEPVRAVYSPQEKAIYFLFNNHYNSSPTSQVGKYLLAEGKLIMATLSSDSYAGDIAVKDGRILATLFSKKDKRTEKTPTQPESEPDKRVVFLNGKDLRPIQTVPVSDYPRLVMAGEDGFYVTTGGIGAGDEVVEKYSYTGQKLGWSYRLPAEGAAWGITFADGNIIIGQENRLTLLGADGSLKRSVPLPGGTMQLGR